MCSCHSILECCVTFSGVKLSIRSFVLLSEALKASARYRTNGKITKAAKHYQISDFDQIQGLCREPKCCLILIF